MADLLEVYNTKPDGERSAYVDGLLNEALLGIDRAYRRIDSAAVFLDTVLGFVKIVENEGSIAVDNSKLRRAEATSKHVNEQRQVYKKNTVEHYIGEKEFAACFSNVTGLTATEQLQGYIIKDNSVHPEPTSRRLQYAWLNLAMGRRLDIRRAGSRKTPGVTRNDIIHARSMLKDYLRESTRDFGYDRQRKEIERLRIIVNEVDKFAETFASSQMRLNQFGLFHVDTTCTDEQASEAQSEALIMSADARLQGDVLSRGYSPEMAIDTETIDPRIQVSPPAAPIDAAANVEMETIDPSVLAMPPTTAGEAAIDTEMIDPSVKSGDKCLCFSVLAMPPATAGKAAIDTEIIDPILVDILPTATDIETSHMEVSSDSNGSATELANILCNINQSSTTIYTEADIAVPEPSEDTADLAGARSVADDGELMDILMSLDSDVIAAAPDPQIRETGKDIHVQAADEASTAHSDTSSPLSDCPSLDNPYQSSPDSSIPGSISATENDRAAQTSSARRISYAESTSRKSDGSDSKSDSENDSSGKEAPAEDASEFVPSDEDEGGESGSRDRLHSTDGRRPDVILPEVPSRLYELLAAIEAKPYRSAGKGLSIDPADRNIITLTPECEEMLSIYVDRLPILREDKSVLSPMPQNIRRQILKLLCLATNKNAFESDRRIRDLWNSRHDIKTWRAAHDEWLTLHNKLGDNPDFLPLWERPAGLPTAILVDKAKLRQQIFGPSCPAIERDLQQKGNAVFEDGFAWIRRENSNLIAIMREEMDVMRFHTRQEARSGKSFKGWNNAAHYLLSSQLCRLDLGLYGQAVASREDENPYQLMTIPAHAKHAEPGDNTYFHHCDFNPNRIWNKELARQGKTGHNRVQVSVSLDDEDENNCTVVVDGLHLDGYRDLAALCRVMHKEVGEHPVVNLGPERLTPNMVEAALGRTFRPIPVPAGGVRFMNSVTFHGSTPTATKTRRVHYPWYVRVDTVADECGKVTRSFETTALRAVDDYIRRIALMETPPSTGGGQSTIDTNPPFRFPAQSTLLPTGHLAAAVGSHTTWDQPAVQKAARRFFDNPYVAIREQRRMLVKQVDELMQTFREAEMEMYGEESYYRTHGNHSPPEPLSYDWSDEMDERYARHDCVREYLAGTGPAKTCLGDGCMSRMGAA